MRVSPTPFVDRFAAERRRLIALGTTARSEVREALERLNAGRLRVAAKGVDRGQGAGTPLVAVPEASQAADGLYMLGQVAALRDRVITMSELHEEVTTGATAWIEQLRAGRVEPMLRPRPSPADVAIVGMAAILPGAEDVATFWANSLGGVDAITEVPARPLGLAALLRPRPEGSRQDLLQVGRLPAGRPLRPASLRHAAGEPAVDRACPAAGAGGGAGGPRRRRLRERPFPRERTAVVLGRGAARPRWPWATPSARTCRCSTRSSPGAGRPRWQQCQGLLPEWTEDSFPGFLLNVTAGRIANRLDLGGANYTVDAACGSSLAALNVAVRELRTGAADMVVLGGVDTVQNPFTYLAFSKTQAFSPRGRCRPFDAGADGIVISEGVAAVILKRLADAERDGDRIYAVIQGVGRLQRRPCRGSDRARPRGPGAGPRARLCRGGHRSRRRSATSRPTAPARPSATWSRSRR